MVRFNLEGLMLTCFISTSMVLYFQHYDADRQEVTEETVFVPMKELAADSRSMSESTSAISGMDYKVSSCFY